MILFVLFLSGVYAQSCTSHAQCERVKPFSYCYQKRECVDCLDCGLYNRIPGAKKCAHERDDCGPCKPGWNAEHNIDESLSVCVPIPETTSSTDVRITTLHNDLEKPESTTLTPFEILASVIFFACLALIFICSFFKKWSCWCKSWRDTIRCTFSSSASPISKPSAPPDTFSNYEPEMIVTHKRNENETQQALPFQTPFYVNNAK